MIDQKHLFRLQPILAPRNVIAAGPLTKQRMTLAYRYELCDLGVEGYVVCPHYVEIGDHGVVAHKSYGDGNYYKKHQLFAALQKFCERLHRDAGCVSSIQYDQCVQPAECPTVSVFGYDDGRGPDRLESVPGASRQGSPGTEKSVPGSVPTDEDTQDFPGK